MTDPRAVDQPLRRLFAGFDRDVDPPADLAVRLRLRVLAEAELDDPIARTATEWSGANASAVSSGVPVRLLPTAAAPMPEPYAPPAPPPFLPRPASPAAGRRRHPRWAIALEVAAALLLLLGAAAVALRVAGPGDRSAPRLGSAVTAVAGPSSEPQLLWERDEPDLTGAGEVAAGDDILVRPVQEMHKSGFLWFETYEYDSFLQALDRRTGEQRWLLPVEGYGSTYVTEDAVLYLGYPTGGTSAATLSSLSLVDGSERWRVGLASTPVYSLTLPTLDGVAFFGTDDGQVLAIDLSDGTQRWSTAVGGGTSPTEGRGEVPSGESAGEAPLPPRDVAMPLGATALVLDGDRLLTFDAAGGIVELDPATGAVAATHPSTVEPPPNVYEGRLFATADRLVTVVTGTDQAFDPKVQNQPRTLVRISAVDRVTGAEVWSTEQLGSAALIAAVDGRLLLWLNDDAAPDTSGTIRALDLTTGAEVWSRPQPPGYPIVSAAGAVTTDGQLLLGTQEGEVVAVDAATGDELWRYAVADGTGLPPSVSGAIAITSDRRNRLIAIAIPENGG